MKVKVLFRNNHEGNDKIQGIKLVRSYTGLGLKESKDLCDAWFTRTGSPVPINGYHILTYEQLGRFMASKMSSDFLDNIWIESLEKVEESNVVDFSDK